MEPSELARCLALGTISCSCWMTSLVFWTNWLSDHVIRGGCSGSGQVSLRTAQEVAVASRASTSNHHLAACGCERLTSVEPRHLLLLERRSASPSPGAQTKQEAHAVRTSAAVDISWGQKSKVRGAVKTSCLYLLSVAPCTSCCTRQPSRNVG